MKHFSKFAIGILLFAAATLPGVGSHAETQTGPDAVLAD